MITKLKSSSILRTQYYAEVLVASLLRLVLVVSTLSIAESAVNEAETEVM
jgi:hypothetical protein